MHYSNNEQMRAVVEMWGGERQRDHIERIKPPYRADKVVCILHVGIKTYKQCIRVRETETKLLMELVRVGLNMYHSSK